MSVHLAARGQAVKFGLALETQLLQPSEFVHPPETDVVPGGFIFASGIAQTNYQTYRSHAVMVTNKWLTEKTRHAFGMTGYVPVDLLGFRVTWFFWQQAQGLHLQRQPQR